MNSRVLILFVFFPFTVFFFLFSHSFLALDRTAILATLPRMYFRVVLNDDLRAGEITS